jgi:hypothetical protein
MIGCKHPIMASGATPIRSTGHAPDREFVTRKNIFTQVEDSRCIRINFEPILELKFDYSLRGYSHWER